MGNYTDDSVNISAHHDVVTICGRRKNKVWHEWTNASLEACLEAVNLNNNMHTHQSTFKNDNLAFSITTQYNMVTQISYEDKVD